VHDRHAEEQIRLTSDMRSLVSSPTCSRIGLSFLFVATIGYSIRLDGDTRKYYLTRK
jgi:hypothetical protein